MQLFIIARAEQRRLDWWKKDISAMYFPYKHKKGNRFLQVGVRPIELLEIVFPEEHLEEVVKALQIHDKFSVDWKDVPILNKAIDMVRKALKLEKLPDIKREGTRRFLYNDDVSRTVIGIKRDIKEEGIEQI